MSCNLQSRSVLQNRGFLLRVLIIRVNMYIYVCIYIYIYIHWVVSWGILILGNAHRKVHEFKKNSQVVPSPSRIVSSECIAARQGNGTKQPDCRRSAACCARQRIRLMSISPMCLRACHSKQLPSSRYRTSNRMLLINSILFKPMTYAIGSSRPPFDLLAHNTTPKMHDFR